MKSTQHLTPTPPSAPRGFKHPKTRTNPWAWVVGLALGTMAPSLSAQTPYSCGPAAELAQQRYWFFGTKVGLDFGTTGTGPVSSALNIANPLSLEGTVTATNSSGVLQFFAGPTTVYNATGAAMANGTGLVGNTSSGQGAVAFQRPGYPNHYFLITNQCGVALNDPNGNLYYHQIDMAQNGGLGAVTTKNVLLGAANTASEALAAVPNHDGSKAWVLTATNGANRILAYEFDRNGPTGVVVTTTLSSNNGLWFGTLRFSADMTKVVQLSNNNGETSWGPTQVRLLDFNAQTGQLTENWTMTIPSTTLGAAYGADFSPNGNYIYVSSIGSGGLFQYDLASNTGAGVLASGVRLATSGSIGNIRRAPNGKMYVANLNQNTISVINSPNTGGVGADFVLNGLSLAAGQESEWGLPEMVQGCTVALTDTDTDGIADVDDLDDDNDGILDSAECLVSNNLLSNGSFTGSGTGWTYGGNWNYQSAGNMYIFAENDNNDRLSQTFSAPTFNTPSSMVPVSFEIQASGPGPISFYAKIDVLVNNTVVATITNPTTSNVATVVPSSGATTSIASFDIGGSAGPFTPITVNVPSSLFTSSNTISFSFYSTSDDFAIDNVYIPSVITSCDTDNDGTPNQLDLDSDGDGCPDAIEGGAAFNAANTTATGALSGSVSSAAATLGVPTLAGAGQAVGSSQNGAVNACTDTDPDGIPDVDDLDDDNDGILDAVEAPSCYFTASEANAIASISTGLTISTGTTPLLFNGVLTTATPNFAFTAGQALANANLFTVTYPTPVNLTSLTIVNATSLGTSATAKLQGSEDGTTWVDLTSAAVSIATTANKVFTVNQNAGEYQSYRVLGVATATSLANPIFEITSILNAAYNPSGHPKATCSVDTDNDGLTNNLDLDSDGDGCPDAIEGGAAFTTANITATGALSGAVSTAAATLGVPTSAGAGQAVGTSQNAGAQDANCPPCLAGTTAPTLSAPSVSNVCPATTVNLTTLTASNRPANTTLTWHTGTPATTANKITGTAVAAGTYYAAFFDASLNCYSGTLGSATTTVTAVVTACVDTDGDGAFDVSDLDDDNDGILDADENICQDRAVADKTGVLISKPATISYVFNGNSLSSLVDNLDPDAVITQPTGTLSNSPWLNIEFPVAKVLTYLEVGHDLGRSLFSTTSTYKIQGSTDNSTWVDVSGALTYNNVATGISGGLATHNSNIANFPSNTNAYKYYRLYGLTASAGTGWATELYFKEICTDVDKDNDGIPNRLDLDSDGDGCSDAIEGGAAFTTAINPAQRKNIKLHTELSLR